MTTYIPAQASDYAAPAQIDPSRKRVVRADELAGLPLPTKDERAEFQEACRRAEAKGDRALELLRSAECNPWLSPDDDGKLFARANGKFIGEHGSLAHHIHCALNAVRDADDEDEREECEAELYSQVEAFPREALNYFKERAHARGENWAALIAALTVKNKLKGAQHV